jgi:two-component system NtrC family response regulator/two-component system nitrogen regulation response regulator GlnG
MPPTLDPQAPQAPAQLSILLVDDDPNFTAALAGLLHREGYGVLIAHDEAEALLHLTRRQPEALVIDIHLSAQNGLDLARALRARCGAALPILILSADAEMETLRHLRDSGATAYLHKSAPAPIILQCLAALLRPGPLPTPPATHA